MNNQAALENSRPSIKLLQVWDEHIAAMVEVSENENGHGVCTSYWVGKRPVGSSKWVKCGADISPNDLPGYQSVAGLYPDQSNEITLIGESPYGAIEAVPVVASFGAAKGDGGGQEGPEVSNESQQEQVVEDAKDSTEKDVIANVKHRTLCSWILAWDKFPGVAPSRGWGTFDNPGNMTAVFLTDPQTLRLQLEHETPSESFPERVIIERPVRDGRLEFRQSW